VMFQELVQFWAIDYSLLLGRI